MTLKIWIAYNQLFEGIINYQQIWYFKTRCVIINYY